MQVTTIVTAILAAWFSLFTTTNADGEAQPIMTPAELVGRVRRGHPRLLISDKGFEQLKTRVPRDPVLKQWVDTLRREADKLLDKEPARYEIPDGKRLLSVSRRVLQRTYTLALVYRLQGDVRYRDRLWRELRTVAEFKDWNPSHFLDTAEMAHAVAIGYDWLYGDWNDEQRRTLREAMVRHALTPGRKCYRGESSYGRWHRSNHNWNQVCNGGLTTAALAIADEEPELAGEILVEALQSVPRAMASYAPDGAWGEGVSYWHYATSYNVLMIAVLESAMGTDFGLSKAKGFDRTGLFPIHLLGPNRKTFNFADVKTSKLIRAPELFWLSRRFNSPLLAVYQRQHAAPHPLDVIWYPPAGLSPEAPPKPLDSYFRQSEVVTLRSAWDDADAIFIGFKAGNNAVNHSNLDLGSFVLDALGQRWAVDLGSDNYNLPSYFGKDRWNYYRMRAEGHNTLVINPEKAADQDPKAETRITQFESNEDDSFAIADLTPAYRLHAESVQRGIRLIDRQRVLVQDEVRCKKPSDLWWFMHTPAEAAISDQDRTAILSQSNRKVRLRIVEPAKARFQVLPAQPLATSPAPPGQQPNTDLRKLAIHLSNVVNARIVVVFDPVDESAIAPALPEETPLSAW